MHRTHSISSETGTGVRLSFPTEDCPFIDGGWPKLSDREAEFARYYSSWDDALAGHHAVCKRVFGNSYTGVR
jgi:hypothetical protein